MVSIPSPTAVGNHKSIRSIPPRSAWLTLMGMQVHGLLAAVTWGNKLAFIPWLIFAQITLLYRYQEGRPAALLGKNL